MKNPRPRTAVRLARIQRAAGLLASGLLAAIACKSFVIDENVYTGASSSRSAPPATGGLASPGAGGASSIGQSGRSSLPGSGGAEASEGPEAMAGATSDARTDPGTPEPEILDEPFSKSALLRQIAKCTLTRYQEFEVRALALNDAARANVDAPSPTTTLAVQDAWLKANASWQVAEPFRFGPAARRADDDPGAQELRDQIYAWRFGGRCPVETALVDGLYASATFGTSLINNRGLGAAEYLLFYPGSDNECPSYSAINLKGSWAALGAAAVLERKRAYAAALAADILKNASKLLEAWQPSGGNFIQKLSQTGGTSVYANEQAALNAVFNGIFYIEKEVKDYKLGIPLGVSDCVAGLCPEALESRYAQVSTANIKQNYLGFRRLFQGCGGKYSGLGFDDWLDAIGATDLRARMLSALDGAQVAIDALDPPIEVSLVAHTDRVWAVYSALKKLTDLLKSEFVTVLDLELPAGAGSDND